MKSLREDYYSPAFSHIYVEENIRDHPRTKRILEKFPKAGQIEIKHYKDVFCRRGQDYSLQHRTQKLILAEKTGNLIYQGAPVCQNFGNDNFYYTSCMMNCIFDCEYCYLKGMYPSGNMVIFVNLEDIFAAVEKLLEQGSVYLCISYDADLLAVEHVIGYMEEWENFAAGRENLKIEVRTKSAYHNFRQPDGTSNIIYAFTLSPQAVIDAYEHGTPSLSRRIACAAEAAERGAEVRLCFDPMLYVPQWKKQYAAMLDQIFSKIRPEQILDISVGTFRVPQDYLKKMRKDLPHSAAVQFPYRNIDGVYQYAEEIADEMVRYMADRWKEKILPEKIFVWEKDGKKHV